MEEPLGRKFGAIAKTYLGALTKQLSHLDIERCYFPLMLICESKKKPLSQQQLADKLNIDKVSAQRTVDYLLEAGYILKFRSETDKRSYLLSPTKKALKELSEIESTVKALNTTLLKSIHPHKPDLFIEMLENIHQTLQETPSVKIRLGYKRISKKDE